MIIVVGNKAYGKQVETMQKILVVEDDADIAANIADYLQSMDPTLQVEVKHDGFDGFSAAATDDTVALAVFDIGLPGMDGLNLTKRLRALGWKKPVIMLTARDTVPDRVRGLESGADDYLVKPFSLAELHARIRAHLRRSEFETMPSVLRVEDLWLDLRMWTVQRAGVPVKLNVTAMKILALLMKKSPMVVTKEELADEVWGASPSAETVRSHMYMLRNAVDKPFEKPLIKTIPGVGWTLRAE